MIKIVSLLLWQYWKKLHGICRYAKTILSDERIVAHGPLVGNSYILVAVVILEEDAWNLQICKNCFLTDERIVADGPWASCRK